MLHKSIGFAVAAILLSFVLMNVAQRTTQRAETARQASHAVDPGQPPAAAAPAQLLALPPSIAVTPSAPAQ